MKSRIVRVLAAVTKLYFRLPIAAGKTWLWRNWVHPYLDWRAMTFYSWTTFGVRMRTAFPDMIQTRIYFFGFWDPAITGYVASALKPGDVFIDIGANVGYYTLLASRCVGLDGRVFAFEASPSTFVELEHNLSINNTTNVVARNVAVTGARSKVPIFMHDASNIGASTIVSTDADRKGAEFKGMVDGYPLHELIDPETICSARFIKVDVEGAEWLVVNGIRDLIPRLSPTTEILMEVSAESTAELGGSAAKLLEMFTSAGFTAFEIQNSYSVQSYAVREKPQLIRHDGAPFRQKDFVLRKLCEEGSAD